MHKQQPLTRCARFWLAFGPNLALVALAFFLAPSGEDYGPALLSIAGHHHFVVLHFPIAILMLIPFFEIWDRHNDASLMIRRLSMLAAISIWATCVFGILQGYYNGENYSDLETHLYFGVTASFLAGAAWFVIFQSWRVRVIAQISAVVVMFIAAHIGGERVHGEILKPNHESTKKPSTKTAGSSDLFIPGAYAAETPSKR